jgi:hypothetical protein
VSNDTCLHQVAAKGSLRQHTQKPQTARCLRKAIIHSTHWEMTNKQDIKHVQSSEHEFKRKGTNSKVKYGL